jgi:hypothetical protein
MNTNAYKLQLMLVRPPALALSLRRAEEILCAGLCAIVTTIFWAIALICFVVWCIYKIVRGMIWISGVLWRVITWPIEILVIVMAEGVWLVWVVLVWVGGRLYRLVVATARLLRRLWDVLQLVLRMLSIWAIREFGDSMVCACCVYLGVLSTGLLPTVLLAHVAPVVLVGLVLSPLTAFAITARVFDNRAYRRWQSNARTRLGVRLLRAYSDGLTWGAWLRQRRARIV